MTRTRAAILAVACLALGAALGRWTAREPDRTETTRIAEAARVRTVEVAMDRAEWVTRRDEVAETHRVRIVYRERMPDGTERSLEREESGARTESHATADGHHEAAQAAAEVRTVTRTVERVVEVHDPLPDWRLSGMVGAGEGGLLYGGAVERRILGPVSLGAWALGGAAWAAGGMVGVEW